MSVKMARQNHLAYCTGIRTIAHKGPDDSLARQNIAPVHATNELKVPMIHSVAQNPPLVKQSFGYANWCNRAFESILEEQIFKSVTEESPDAHVRQIFSKFLRS